MPAIDLGNGWVTKAELTYPSAAQGHLPLVVFLHGSGRNDMNQTLPGGKGSTCPAGATAALPPDPAGCRRSCTTSSTSTAMAG
ncbi:hypothetical protein AB0C07_14400 [Actinoplanes missouriensis]|uniref:hypothetical protein n=1 Tax=Actinoplanes missouriensis TaxID=1866 RepID=UPI0033C3C8DA